MKPRPPFLPGDIASSRIRQGTLDERRRLEDLQLRSSLANPGDATHLLELPEIIELPDWQLSSGRILVAKAESALLGFTVLLPRIAGECELDGMFVEPSAWRKGIGVRLFGACAALAHAEAAKRITALVNPHALNFYLACGFTQEGVTTTQFGPAYRMSLEL